MTFDIEGSFATEGVACVRRLLDDAMLALATEAIERALAAPTPLMLRASTEDDGAFVEDFVTWPTNEAMRELVTHPRLGRLAAHLTDSRVVRLHHDHVLVKEAGTAQRTPWHQDQPYYNVDGRQNVSFWIPIDPVPRSASLEVVVGSQLGPWYLPRTFMDGAAKWFPEGSLAEFPDLNPSAGHVEVRGWSLEPGDAICFHMAAVHGAPGFEGPGRRRVVSVRYVGDDAVHAPRPWRTPPPFPGLEDDLAAGQPFEHPSFPVVWEDQV